MWLRCGPASTPRPPPATTHPTDPSLPSHPNPGLISCCLPCVTYGSTAETVHGPTGSCVNHGLKYYLYSCLCLCALVSAPTRRAIRDGYQLPPDPPGLGDPENTDCLVHTIPCTACFALCQEANELRVSRAGGAWAGGRDIPACPPRTSADAHPPSGAERVPLLVTPCLIRPPARPPTRC